MVGHVLGIADAKRTASPQEQMTLLSREQHERSAREQQQQQKEQQQHSRMHSRTLSTLSTFSLPAVAADSLDWALLAEDTADSGPSLMGFDDAAPFSGVAVDPVGGGGLCGGGGLSRRP